jgi:type II secretory pathway pseudopilin PulG
LGLTAVEVVVVLIIIALTVLIMLLAVPRAREEARLTACQRNLGQIGIALALYDQMHQSLPTVGELAGLDEAAVTSSASASPLRTLLDTLQLPDLIKLTDSKTPPEALPGEVPGELPVPGFVCASDPNATALHFTAPISYRATTGGSVAGHDGAFARGRVLRLDEIQAGDGRGYTAGFSERLVGDNQANHITEFNYQVVSGPLPSTGCPAAPYPFAWRGDAGSSWTSSSYRSTLYNHSLRPGGSPSCVASDGKTAYMGSSSGHVRGVNLLLLDGSVTLVRPSIDQKIWRELATIGPANSPQ